MSNGDKYSYIEESLQKYYQFVRVLKKDDKKEILLYKHKVNGKYMKVKRLS